MVLKTLDLKTRYKALYLPPKTPALVEVPELLYLRLDGAIEKGSEPGLSPGFQEAVGALYGFAYTLKFASKKRKTNPIDYPVMALEGLWWVEGGDFYIDVKDNWLYTLQIMVPPHITPEMFEAARAELEKKRPSPALGRVRRESFAEGECVHVLHVGPYATEPETVERMRAFAEEKGYRLRGRHHEIYLGDPRRAKPEKLKTGIRHGVEKR